MGRIEWRRDGWTIERGFVDGIELFRLDHPDQQWVKGFTITSPLIKGAYEVPWEEHPSPLIGTKKAIKKKFEAEQADYQEKRERAHRVAETVLTLFAKSVLEGVDEPKQTG